MKVRLIICLLLSPLLLYATQPDIYDHHQAIADQLEKWQTEPPLQVTLDNPDTVISDFFPDAWISELDTVYSIIYPELSGVLNTSLLYYGYDSNHKFDLRLLLEIEDRKLYAGGGKHTRINDKETLSLGDRLVLPDSIDTDILKQHLDKQLLYYRTAGIPDLLINHNPSFPDTVTLKLVGRFPGIYRYAQADFKNILNRFCFRQSVYADVMMVKKLEDNRIGIEYIIVLVSPDTDKQHLMTINEILETDSIPFVTETEIRLVPYIRTDNISDLYAAPDSTGHDVDKFEVKVR